MTLFAKTRSVIVAAAVAATSLIAAPQQAAAQDYYIGQMINVGFNFCPRNTLQANGQLLAIADNMALFSLLATNFGGDGRTTFGLPDMRGRVSIHNGTGPGLPNYRLGQKAGVESNTLTVAQMPAHTHTVNSVNEQGDRQRPSTDFLAKFPGIYHDGPANTTMDPGMIGSTGDGQPITNMQPYLVTNWCIVTQGIYPSRP
ncbi:phage tail protein [Tropicibacter naphthalenivorans]|uniref:Phage Tail Collar Domain protein n=1 Tax=Tropicibacter naphthalenivorans TaxID=441103 RepID=A0A0P1G3Z3_9RHOB|nr:tail fiber protein [Tropicibacter naphthalenivorans]CUH76538.1 Phage Tail Collar Domain protein [Tropicibacter naphthalenivorans]SMC65512.1 Microcystin-dependent protein [Tropicibacter naphthalenivorans]